jgi:hypothetical protein
MSVRPHIFQEIAQARLEIHWRLLNDISDMQIRLGEILVQHVLHQKEMTAESAKKLQDDLSDIRGRIVALKKKE